MLHSVFSLKKTEILGLDIGQRSVKLARLVHTEKNLTGAAFLGLLETKTDDSGFVGTLRHYIAQHNLAGLKAAACLDDPSLKIRKIELPKMPENDLREAVRWKIRDVLEGPVEGYIVRHSLLDKSYSANAKKLTLIGYAVKKSAVDELVQTINAVGLKPAFIEPAAVSLAISVERAVPASDEWNAGVDLSSGRTLMAIIGRGKLHYSRPLPGITAPEEGVDSAFNQKLAAEIQNTIDAFSVAFEVDKINRIFLSGRGAVLPGLTAYLSTNLGIQTLVNNPFSDVTVEPAMEKIVQEKPHLFSGAVSLARMGL